MSSSSSLSSSSSSSSSSTSSSSSCSASLSPEWFSSPSFPSCIHPSVVVDPQYKTALVLVQKHILYRAWDHREFDWGPRPPSPCGGAFSLGQTMVSADRLLFAKWMMHSTEAGIDDFTKRLIREIQCYSILLHPHDNVLRLWYMTFSPRNEIIFIYSYQGGGTLQDRLDDPVWLRELKPSTVVDIMIQIYGGVAHLHDRGLQHRDLKPSNIFFDHTGKILRIGDFGLISSEFSVSFVGSPGYMSPEKDPTLRSILRVAYNKNNNNNNNNNNDDDDDDDEKNNIVFHMNDDGDDDVHRVNNEPLMQDAYSFASDVFSAGMIGYQLVHKASRSPHHPLILEYCGPECQDPNCCKIFRNLIYAWTSPDEKKRGDASVIVEKLCFLRPHMPQHCTYRSCNHSVAARRGHVAPVPSPLDDTIVPTSSSELNSASSSTAASTTPPGPSTAPSSTPVVPSTSSPAAIDAVITVSTPAASTTPELSKTALVPVANAPNVAVTSTPVSASTPPVATKTRRSPVMASSSVAPTLARPSSRPSHTPRNSTSPAATDVAKRPIGGGGGGGRGGVSSAVPEKKVREKKSSTSAKQGKKVVEKKATKESSGSKSTAVPTTREGAKRADKKGKE
eukprot:TRINITY_DN8269_c0_g1_i2.p1 TRINITY_DN8269_c0_g1~~TRINITY_DN8269_c0_g1_i2.p1  ORF type:complete len:619 (-),score=117.90 TRINITY_DN8269_c0_g1_i2:105-1961(-)